MLLNSVITLLLAAVATILCVLILKSIAHNLALVDHPDQRKDHIGAIPLIGGIAIWIGFTLSLLFIGMSTKLLVLLAAGGLLTIVGALDDANDLSPRWRLVLHIGAALAVCVVGGVVAETLGDIIVPGFELKLGFAAIPFTVFAIVALVNASNMSDGLDGLCALQILIPLAGLAFLAGIHGDQERFLPLVAICGCIIGFLSFNLRTRWRSRASVFLGDAGSNLLGLVLAWFLIDMSQGEDALLRPVAVLWFALLLIYDTVEVVIRRLLRGKSPFVADKEHLHHVFLLARFSVSETVMALGFIAFVGVVIGISTTFVSVPDSALFAAFVLLGMIFLRWILHTWSVMRFLYRSICRRRGERRRAPSSNWSQPERRSGADRRGRQPSAAGSGQ
jgi:UDP-GlcNAc:undecaprenyl-phosphate GlcNAc-1-phosphate transferase